ncbi:MAG: sulfite exporter TauE/SafE family protein, partial [Planctomycetota bacterium]
LDGWAVLAVAALGLAAGTLGGMLGVGGSMLMIPGLVMILGRSTGAEQHVYQAAAMGANVAVAVPAALRHRKSGAMTPAALRWMLPGAVGCVVLGVGLSNLPVFRGERGGVWLGRGLAVLLVYMIAMNLRKLWAAERAGKRAQAEAGDAPEAAGGATPGRGLTVGVVMGTVAGLLGIGGGAIAVPLQQALMRLPVRSCIANSSAVICGSAAVGALYKNLTLTTHTPAAGPTLSGWEGVTLMLILAPTAWAGGRLGASLTHRLPLRLLRGLLILLLTAAAWKMAAL